MAYHDSCYLARYNGVAEEPREAIGAAAGAPLELPRNREQSFCCGAGGGRMWMEEHIGKRVNVERAEEAVRTGAETIATACPFCMTMLSDGVKETPKPETKVRDIAELIAEKMGL